MTVAELRRALRQCDGDEEVRVWLGCQLPLAQYLRLGDEACRLIEEAKPPMFVIQLHGPSAPSCKTCDYCEPRKFRCRKLESLPHVGEFLNRGGSPKWCPLTSRKV